MNGQSQGQVPDSSWREIFNTVNDAIFIHDAGTGEILDANRKTAELFGYPVEEFRQLEVGDISSGAEGFTQQEALGKIRQAVEKGENLFEWHCRKRSGELFWVEVNLKTATLLDRDIVLALIRDITRRKTTAEELRLSESKFRKAFFASPDSITISSLATGELYEVNDGFLDLSGYDRDEVIGKSALDLELWPEAGDRKQMIEMLRSSGRIRNREVRFRDRTGAFHTCLLSVEIIDIYGEPCNLSVVRDITGWKRTEEALKRSEEQYRNLVENARDAIFTLSDDGQVLTLNLAFEKITGWSREEWIGRPFLDILHPEDREKAVHLVAELMSGSIPPISELRIVCSSGEYVIGEFASAPTSVDGTPVGILGIARDITYRKNLEDQLRQAQKLESIGTLAGGIAHDFNNMLNIVLAHTQLISRSDYDPIHLRSSIEAITRAGERGARIVQQLLTFARQTEAVFEPIDLNRSVGEIGDIITSTFPKTITISVTLADDLPLVRGDTTRIHQVLLNLCVNARDAMPGGGEISLATRLEDRREVRKRHPEADREEYLCIEISDTGTGMDEDTRRRIFEPFFTTKETGQGTGLGLAVVYGIIRDHDGFLSVRSKPGSGTTFRIYLPALSRDAAETATLCQPEETFSATGGETLLVVEDEEAILELLENLFRENGYRVMTAPDGTAAVSLFGDEKDSIDLVLTDVGLPGLSGEEVFHAIRQIKPEIRVILASGYLDAEMHTALIRDGVSDVIQKPYQFNYLLRRVRQVLDSNPG
jgi:PAS domain S-box-containing protein